MTNPEHIQAQLTEEYGHNRICPAVSMLLDEYANEANHPRQFLDWIMKSGEVYESAKQKAENCNGPVVVIHNGEPGLTCERFNRTWTQSELEQVDISEYPSTYLALKLIDEIKIER